MPTNDLHIEWGRRLTQARQEAKLSIRELARRTGIHASHLARFETGDAGLGDEYRIGVASELGHPVEDLFPYPDTTPKDDPCRSAEPATDAAQSPTPATTAATPSPAPPATEPAASAPAANHATKAR